MDEQTKSKFWVHAMDKCKELGVSPDSNYYTTIMESCQRGYEMAQDDLHEVLQELTDNCLASTAESDISATRKMYRLELHQRAAATLRKMGKRL